MAGSDLPKVGVALNVGTLRQNRGWVLSSQRDVELNDIARPNALQERGVELLRESRELLEGHTGRRGIHGPFKDLPIAASDDDIRRIVTERALRSLDYAAELNASHLVIHSDFYFNTEDPHMPHTEHDGLDGAIAATHASLDPVVRRAEEIGCHLVVENILDRYPRRLRRIVESFDSPFVRMSIDVGHAYWVRTLTGSGSPADQWVQEAGDLLEHLHLQDTDGEADRHWAPGTGYIQWHALFDALSQLEHHPRLIVETRDDPVPGTNWLIERGFVV